MTSGGMFESSERWDAATLVYAKIETLVRENGWNEDLLADSFYANFTVVSYNAGDTALAKRLGRTYVVRTAGRGPHMDRVEQVLSAIERTEREYQKDAQLFEESLARVRQYPDDASIRVEYVKIGLHLLSGRGTVQDCDRAALWFANASTKGSAAGAEMLGDMYRIGLGVGQRYSDAVRWYKRAIGLTKRSYRAMNNLGVMYYLGLGLPRNTAKARALFSDGRSDPTVRANLDLPAGTTPKWYDEPLENHTCVRP